MNTCFGFLFENYKKREQKRNEQIKTILTIVTTSIQCVFSKKQELHIPSEQVNIHKPSGEK